MLPAQLPNPTHETNQHFEAHTRIINKRVLRSSSTGRAGGTVVPHKFKNLIRFTALFGIVLYVAMIVLVSVSGPPSVSGAGSRADPAPEIQFTITDSFDPSHPLDNGTGAEVYFNDTLSLLPEVADSENHTIVNHSWTFECLSTGYFTSVVGEELHELNFIAGVDHLFSGIEDDGLPVIPAVNSEPEEYRITLEGEDENHSQGSYSLNILIRPLSHHTFREFISVGEVSREAMVELTWRGKSGYVASGPESISSVTPVFVMIEETASPDLNLWNKGGIGPVLKVEVLGCTFQNGSSGFEKAVLFLPFNSSNLQDIGDPDALTGDVSLEFYHEKEKRFVVAEGGAIMENVGDGGGPDGGGKYALGRIGNSSIFTVIVDSVYDPDNPRYQDILPDLRIERIHLSSCIIENGREVEVIATIANTGRLHARNVEVRIYDGSDLVENLLVQFVPAGGDARIADRFDVSMLNTELSFEHHRILVQANPRQAIREGSGSYEDNEMEKLLVIYPRWSHRRLRVSVEYLLLTLYQEYYCNWEINEGSDLEIKLGLTNFGSDPVAHVTTIVSIDGRIIWTEQWDGSESDEVKTHDWKTVKGEHILSVTLQTDQGTVTENKTIWVNEDGNDFWFLPVFGSPPGIFLIVVLVAIPLVHQRKMRSKGRNGGNGGN